MQCPLCAGPLRLEHPDRFICERNHVLSSPELERAAASRVTVAFWMAIEALESEAEALRVLAGQQGVDVDLARQAEEDARVLRKLAMARIGGDGDDGGDGPSPGQ